MQTLAFIQQIGMPEIAVILVVVLIIFGPKNLPKLGRALGQGMREFKDATNKVTESITNMEDFEEKEEKSSNQRSLSKENDGPIVEGQEKKEADPVHNRS